MKLHNDFEKIYNDVTFKRPIFPSYWVSEEPDYQEVTEITMSCGGGTGGSRWNEYVQRIELEELASKENCFIARRYTGELIVLNPSFIVMARQLTIASMVLDTTNPYNTGRHTYRVLVEDGHALKLI